jgi:HemY protein
MRAVIWLLLLFAVAVVAAATLGANDGLVSVYWAPWRVDVSLNFFLLVWVAATAALYFAFGTLHRLFGLPERARLWRLQRREQAAQKSLREALGLLFAGRYGRAHKAALQALDIQARTPEIGVDADFIALAHLLSASSLHRLQDRQRRDEQLALAQSALGPQAAQRPVGEGALLLAAEWAIDDREAERSLEQLAQLPAGVARRTQAMRLRLQAARLARQPLEALRTARLLAKHQGFAPAAAQGIVRTLALETLDTARDADQLRRIWAQLDTVDHRDPYVCARAASRAVELGAPADARTWLRPQWDHLSRLGERERQVLLDAFVLALPGLPADWLPTLEAALVALPQDASLAYAAGRAMAERNLWGRARRLLEGVTTSRSADLALRRHAWRALARIAEQEGDEPRMRHCYEEIAAGD